MAENIISNLQLTINDQLIAYTPNTLTYIKNSAKTVIKSITVGGISASTVHSLDISEATSVVTFSYKNTNANIANLDTWLSKTAENVIELSDENGVVALAFSGMSVEEPPASGFGADTDIEITFKGDPII